MCNAAERAAVVEVENSQIAVKNKTHCVRDILLLSIAISLLSHLLVEIYFKKQNFSTIKTKDETKAPVPRKRKAKTQQDLNGLHIICDLT